MRLENGQHSHGPGQARQIRPRAHLLLLGRGLRASGPLYSTGRGLADRPARVTAVLRFGEPSTMQALILAGGSGTRFWPLSRRSRPKQLIALDREECLLRATVDRLATTINPGQVWVCTTAALATMIREVLPDVPGEQLLVEPVGRNTAPAIAYAVRMMPEAVRNGVIAVLPADHRVEDTESFRRTLRMAEDAALDGRRILTLGVTPHRVETGYGYLELGQVLDGPVADAADGTSEFRPEMRHVARFTEKPDHETAARWIDAGSHLWNAGIFVFQGQTLLDALARFEPEIARVLEAIGEAPERAEALYPQLPAVSIDYGVMERLDDLATLPLDCGWSDLGSWQALAEVLPTDVAGNTVRGDVTLIDSRDSLIIADTGHVAVVGVDGLVVVRTGDSVLIMPKERSQDVRRVVETLREGRRDELL